ncbi:MAG: hypothetical protein P4L33_07630 [Capsulimonadaceae bacterium]|nr:hypothetical protein [Capsulimonadaceae bacterium]
MDQFGDRLRPMREQLRIVLREHGYDPEGIRVAWLYNNPEARASFDRGVKESEAGDGVAMDIIEDMEEDDE